MRIGVAREVKDGERRVAFAPEGVRALVGDGHDVVVGAGAGEGAGFDDRACVAAGARIADGATEVLGCALVVKVKELQPQEWPMLAPRATVFGFAQLNRDPLLLDAVLRARVRVIAFEAAGVMTWDGDVVHPGLAEDRGRRAAGRVARGRRRVTPRRHRKRL